MAWKSEDRQWKINVLRSLYCSRGKQHYLGAESSSVNVK